MYPELKESTVRGMHLKYEEELRNALKEKQDPRSALPAGQHKRPLLLGKIDLIVQNYLRVCNYFRVPNKFFPTPPPPHPTATTLKHGCLAFSFLL